MQVGMQGQRGGLGRGEVEAAEKGVIQDLGCEGQVSIQLVSHTHARTHARTWPGAHPVLDIQLTYILQPLLQVCDAM